MKRKPSIVATLAGLAMVFCHTTANAQNLTAREVFARTVSEVIQPGYERLANEAKITGDAFAVLCASPSPNLLTDTQSAFAKLVDAFGRVEMIRFGPVLKDNRIDRLLFWPDRKGIGLKQVQAALANGDETVTSAKTLAIKSVALQGLGTLEFILHGTGAEELAQAPKGGFRCRFGHAVSDRILATATEVAAEWKIDGGIATQITAPGPANPLYRNERESLAEILGILVHGYRAILDVKLSPLTGVAGKPPKPRRALFRRSGLNYAIIAANFEGLGHLFETSGLGRMLPADQNISAASMAFEFRNVNEVLGQISTPVIEAVSDPVEAGRFRYLTILTRSLHGITVDEILPALGVTVGFSSLDGD